MRVKKRTINRTAQDIQDDIFRKMSADRKVEIGGQLWLLAKELDSDKINYARRNRTQISASKNSRNS